MGEVYRALDSRLGRQVAIKVATGRFSDHFEREVQAIAVLNHPHIYQIYDVRPNYLGVRLKVGGQAAAFSSVRNCGYHRRNTSSNSLFNTLVRACSNRCAPFSVHCICCFFTNRRLTT